MNKKNLLVITPCFPDIKSNTYNCHFVYEYVNLIKENFDTVYVISPMSYIPKIIRTFPKLKEYATDYIEKDYYKIDNIKIFYPKISFFPLNILCNSFKIKMGLRLIKNITKNLDFDLIHAHFIFPSGYYAKEISKKRNKPFLITSHEGNIKGYFTRKKKHKTETLKQANKIVSVSAINKKHIKKELPKLKNIKIINNFIDSKNFFIKNKMFCKKKLNIKNKSFIILNVANLKTHKKGQLDLIKSIKQIKKLDIKLYLIGKGPDKEIIQEEIKKNKLKNKVKLIGAINNADLINWYNVADLFVFPSYYESFGIVQIEAMACGTPVIAYANEGSKEVLKGYKQNLIKIGDKKALAKKIEEKLKDSNLNSAKKKIERRNYVKKNFSEEKVKEELLKVYEELLSQQD